MGVLSKVVSSAGSRLGVAYVLVSIVLCGCGEQQPESDSAKSGRAEISVLYPQESSGSSEITQVEVSPEAIRRSITPSLESLTNDEGQIVSPTTGFDCEALIQDFALPITNLESLLVEAKSEEEFLALSDAQINLADGVRSCENGDDDATASFLQAALEAMRYADR